jgi:hypothetical protein
MTTTTTFSYQLNGKSFKREFFSLGSITHYCENRMAHYAECNWRFLEIYQFQFETELVAKEVEYTKSIVENN